MLQRWNREYESFLHTSFPDNGKKMLSEEQREILSLKKQLKDVEIERDILKKAVSIASSPRATAEVPVYKGSYW